MNGISQIIQIETSLDYDDREIRDAIKKKYKINISDYEIYHRSLDARRSTLKFNLKLLITHNKKLKDSQEPIEKYDISFTKKYINVAVIGAGPSGLFAAYVLAKNGAKVDLYERGGDMEKRLYDVSKFIKTRELDENSNISFGEGGAGTFSDGKLTSRSKDPKKEYVKEVLVNFGAPREILIDQKPHIGTDKMRKIIYKFRKNLEELGVNCHFNTLVNNFIIENKSIKKIEYVNLKENKVGVKEYDKVILAIGNAARDTFLTLIDEGVYLESKPFSVGFRIEHNQDYIDRCQFKDSVGHPRLLRGEYNLTAKTSERGVYSFCMCPGGLVVPSASEKNHLSVNGMSYHDRALKNSNSAIVANVNDLDDPKSAIFYQREIEKRAFILGGSDYKAPAIHVRDFLEGISPKTKSSIIPSYELGVTYTKIDDIFEKEVLISLREGLVAMGNKMRGFLDDAILTAVESKTSSPVRINRDEDFNTNIKNLISCGEGAGYAGGIVSAALDGLKCAEKVLEVS